jgi:hypothetical protein
MMRLSDDEVACLQDLLNADTSGKLRQQVVTALAALQQRLTLQAQKLQSPQTFQLTEAASRATQSAMLVMMMVNDDPEVNHERRAPWQT